MNGKIKVVGVFTLIILFFIGINSYAVTPTLEQIVNKFNNCSTVKDYASKGSVWKATNEENKIITSVTTNDKTIEWEYNLEGSILKAEFSGENAFSGLILCETLTDCIGQLNGYSEGELYSTLNSDKIQDYSVENEGFEIKKTSDGTFKVQIDISKKIPLIDVCDSYIEVSDLEGIKNFISGDGSAEKSKGKIWFNKSGYDGKNTILIAEEGELTENTYKSILSIIEVMFDSSKAADYFKENYPQILTGNKEFDGFKIEVNPTKTEFEEKLIPEDSGYRFIRITVDKEIANKGINGSSYTEKENTTYSEEKNIIKKDNTTSNNKLPKAGKNIVVISSIIGFMIILLVNYRKYNKFKIIK